MKKTAIILAIVLLLAACGPARGGEGETLPGTGSTAPTPTVTASTASTPGTTTDSEENKMTLAEAYRAVTKAGELTDEVTYYKFGDLYYIFRIRTSDINWSYVMAVKLYCFDGITGTLVVLNGGEEYHMLQCRIQDASNFYYLTARERSGGGNAPEFPEIVHLRMASQRTSRGSFSCSAKAERTTYYAPVREDFYAPTYISDYHEGPSDRILLKASDTNEGVALLMDFYDLQDQANAGRRSFPNAYYYFEHDAENGTFAIYIKEIDFGGFAEGPLEIQNQFIESAALERFGKTTAKITLKLTKLARYYTVAESRVPAPDKPPAEWYEAMDNWLENGDLIWEKYKYTLDVPVFYNNFKITFSAGNGYKASDLKDEFMKIDGEEYVALHRTWYEGSVEDWKSDWEEIEYIEEPVNFIADGSKFMKWIKEDRNRE